MLDYKLETMLPFTWAYEIYKKLYLVNNDLDLYSLDLYAQILLEHAGYEAHGV